jgi:hypothetical protein
MECYKYDHAIKFGFVRTWLAIILSKIFLCIKENKTEIMHAGEIWVLVDGRNMFFCSKTKKHAHFCREEEMNVLQRKLVAMGGVYKKLPPTDKETLAVLIKYSKSWLKALEASEKWCKKTKEKWGGRPLPEKPC